MDKIANVISLVRDMKVRDNGLEKRPLEEGIGIMK